MTEHDSRQYLAWVNALRLCLREIGVEEAKPAKPPDLDDYHQGGGAMIDIVQALDDPNLFGPWFSGPSWATWKAVLKGAFCLPMDADELKLFRGVAERDPPKHRVRELWAIVGRRGARTPSPAAIACYAAASSTTKTSCVPASGRRFCAWRSTRRRPSIVERYTRSYFSEDHAVAVTGEAGDGGRG